MKRWILIAAGAALALVAAFVAGRFSAPVKVVETVKVETKIEWRDREVVKQVRGPVRIQERIVEKPGAERIIVRTIERGAVTTDSTRDASGATATTAASTRVVEGGRPGWAAAVAASWDPGRLSLEPSRVGLEIDRRLFGTIWLGARASATTTAAEPAIGLALRMEF